MMRFEAAAETKPGLAVFLYDALLEKVAASGDWTIVDSDKIQGEIKALRQAKPDLNDEQAKESVMRQLGLAKLCTGSLTRVGVKYFVSLKTLNPDQTLDQAARFQADTEDALIDCVDQMAAKLAGKSQATTGSAESSAVAFPTLRFDSTPAATSARPTDGKMRIGIMKFEVASDLKPSLGQFLYSTLMEQMLAAKRFAVVDWEEIDKVLGYVAKAQPNLSPEEARKQAVHQLGLEKMYLGSVSKLGSKYFVNVKVLNLDLSLDRAERTSVDTEEELETAAVDLVKLLCATPDAAKELRATMERQKVESEKWAEVRKGMTEEKLETFLRAFPEGVMAQEAKKTLDEMRSIRLSREEEWKRREAEQQIAAKEAEKLRQNIAGRWRLETAAGTCQYEGRAFTFNSAPGPVICDIVQKNSVVSFVAPAASTTKTKQVTYKGTYESGCLRATYKSFGGTYIIAGNISEDGRRIEGEWTLAMLSGKAVFTRMASEAKP
jgi:hypothetical protein